MDLRNSLTIPSLMLLAACSVEPSNEERPAIPSYAIMAEYDEFYVSCGNVRSSVQGRVENLFYNEDGEMKTREQFCNENSVETRIRR